MNVTVGELKKRLQDIPDNKELDLVAYMDETVPCAKLLVTDEDGSRRLLMLDSGTDNV